MKKYLKMYLIIPNTLRKYLNTNTNTFVFCTSNTNTNTNTKKKVFKYDQIQIQKYLTPCLSIDIVASAIVDCTPLSDRSYSKLVV